MADIYGLQILPQDEKAGLACRDFTCPGIKSCEISCNPFYSGDFDCAGQLTSLYC